VETWRGVGGRRAATGGEIFWVENKRIGERFKLMAATQRRLN
jgi:hypothetical protein